MGLISNEEGFDKSEGEEDNEGKAREMKEEEEEGLGGGDGEREGGRGGMLYDKKRVLEIPIPYRHRRSQSAPRADDGVEGSAAVGANRRGGKGQNEQK